MNGWAIWITYLVKAKRQPHFYEIDGIVKVFKKSTDARTAAREVPRPEGVRGIGVIWTHVRPPGAGRPVYFRRRDD